MEATVYAHTVEGLFYRSLKGRLPQPLKDELRTLGLDVEQPAHDVPRTRWAEMLGAAVKHLYGALPADEGYFRLGQALMDGYKDTIIGKALFATLRLLGPERVLRRAVSLLQNGNNYVEGRITELAPRRYEMWINECNGNPHYVRGVLTAGLTATGVRALQCEVTAFDGHQATFLTTWA